MLKIANNMCAKFDEPSLFGSLKTRCPKMEKLFNGWASYMVGLLMVSHEILRKTKKHGFCKLPHELHRNLWNIHSVHRPPYPTNMQYNIWACYKVLAWWEGGKDRISPYFIFEICLNIKIAKLTCLQNFISLPWWKVGKNKINHAISLIS